MNTEYKHTPGPLWVIPMGNFFYVAHKVENNTSKGTLVTTGYVAKAWTEANAKLYAVAPELLKALGELIDEFQMLSDVPANYKELNGWDGGENQRTVAMIKAIEIYKKATE